MKHLGSEKSPYTLKHGCFPESTEQYPLETSFPFYFALAFPGSSGRGGEGALILLDCWLIETSPFRVQLSALSKSRQIQIFLRRNKQKGWQRLLGASLPLLAPSHALPLSPEVTTIMHMLVLVRLRVVMFSLYRWVPINKTLYCFASFRTSLHAPKLRTSVYSVQFTPTTWSDHPC